MGEGDHVSGKPVQLRVIYKQFSLGRLTLFVPFGHSFFNSLVVKTMGISEMVAV
jgi:hypothetical protein